MHSIVEMISSHACETPDKIAIIADEEKITYKNLYDEIKSFCCFLKENGIGKGNRVILKSSHTISYAVAVYAIHLSGAALVPVEKNLPPMGAAEISKNVAASFVISDVDPDAGVPFLDYKQIRQKAAEYKDCTADLVFPDDDDVSDILFTTGTTGKSKGVQLSHKSLMTMSQTSIDGTELEQDNVYLVTVPMNHAGGIRKLHMTMYNGSTVVMLDGLMRIKQFFEYIDKYGVTSIYLPPAAVRMVIQLGGEEISKFNSQLRFIYTGSAAYPEGDKEKLCRLLPDVRLYNGYGGSEIGSVSMLNYNKYKGMVGCIGKPNNAVQLVIVDDDKKPIESSPENIGLIAVKSDMNMQCYFNEPELTAGTMENGWIYTSDLAYIDENGFVFMMGRAGDVINVGGLKVAPTEVEEAALRFEDIKDCACTSGEDKRMGKVVRLLVVMKEGKTFDSKAILAFLRQYLEAYKVPKIVEQIEEVPRTFNGKLDRKRLPK